MTLTYMFPVLLSLVTALYWKGGGWYRCSGFSHEDKSGMESFFNLPAGVTKKILFSGKGDLPVISNDTKATFHFKTMKDNEDRTEIDDSRKLGKPFELLFGKKFKLEVWESILKTMKVGEVSEFACIPQHVYSYPVVSRSFRDAVKQSQGTLEEGTHHHHACGMEILQRGLGTPELDDLLHNEYTLIFVIELLKVEQPDDFEKEVWAMSMSEKQERIPLWKEEGNELFKKGNYKEAAELYSRALGCLEQLCLREKPGDPEWKELDNRKIPFLLNYSQCKLLEGDFYEVVKHTSTVLEKDQDNVKALFRRAKAHAACWNPKEAIVDFQRVKELDPSLKNAVAKEVTKLQKEIREKDTDDRLKLRGLFG